ncbi:DoxX family protein [Marinigracilibium pacificum]|uniref:DoxX family protein n=1 Tax=Marinigracilibium pacificum TaxID=2729599 RepID=A0A848J6M2_9BACT|nr:DoxX family protein [Marinigracilibium pacificum]NMM50104.1 DoxX family protein [Marinigracilibium pacificum]
MSKLFYLTSIRSRSLSLALLIYRVAFGAMLLSHGLPKMMEFESLSQSFPDPLGIGSVLSLILVIIAEVICSVFVIFGLITRLSIIPILITMLIAVFIIHGNDEFSKQELGLHYLIGSVFFLIVGPGNYSLDKWILKMRKKKFFK